MSVYELYDAPNSKYVKYFGEWVNRKMLEEFELLYGKVLPPLYFEKIINDCIWIGWNKKFNYPIIRNKKIFSL